MFIRKIYYPKIDLAIIDDDAFNIQLLKINSLNIEIRY